MVLRGSPTLDKTMSEGRLIVTLPSIGQPATPSPIEVVQEENSFNFEASSQDSTLKGLMILVNLRLVQLFQRCEELMVALTTSYRLPLGTTGKICLKLPPKTIVFQPNSLFILNSLHTGIISLKVLSTASMQCL